MTEQQFKKANELHEELAKRAIDEIGKERLKKYVFQVEE